MIAAKLAFLGEDVPAAADWHFRDAGGGGARCVTLVIDHRLGKSIECVVPLFTTEEPMSNTPHATEKATRTRTPVFRAVRRIVDAVEDVVDDVIERGEDAERDARKLVHNLVREREHEEAKK